MMNSFIGVWGHCECTDCIMSDFPNYIQACPLPKPKLQNMIWNPGNFFRKIKQVTHSVGYSAHMTLRCDELAAAVGRAGVGPAGHAGDGLSGTGRMERTEPLLLQGTRCVVKDTRARCWAIELLFFLCMSTELVQCPTWRRGRRRSPQLRGFFSPDGSDGAEKMNPVLCILACFSTLILCKCVFHSFSHVCVCVCASAPGLFGWKLRVSLRVSVPK